ncbi:MAG: DUF309 domain-containing protein [Phycisphaera sp.]|nr:DUF309 domain-containing protein [Phycisphaera sp.]
MPSDSEIFHEGLRCFNEGDWFEAHEVWEDLWHMATGPRKKFLQGLIQLAVTIEHIRRGNPRGVRNVFATALPKFDGITGVYMGIDVPRLLGEMRSFVQPVLDLPSDMFDPAKGRGLDMPVDLDNAPKIELVYDPYAESA